MSKPPTQIVVVGAGHWRGEGMALLKRSSEHSAERGGNMTATRDKFGRPIVVVTGMGVVTSLGAGKADNWTKLTAGESGIRSITRFPTDGLKTTLAGTIDFVAVEPFSSTGLSEQLGVLVAEEAIAQAGIGTKGDFPGPLFLAVPPVEVEWPQRLELGRATGATEIDYDALLRVSGGGNSRHITGAFCSARYRIISPRRSAPRVLRFHFRRPAHPAPRRSSSALKPFVAAKRTRPCASQPKARSIRKALSGFPCCRRCRPRTSRLRLRPNRSRRIATAL